MASSQATENAGEVSSNERMIYYGLEVAQRGRPKPWGLEREETEDHG